MYKFKTVDSKWYADMASPVPIGIVLTEVQSEDGQKMGTTAFIGMGAGPLSLHTERDCQKVASFGDRFPRSAAEALFERKIEDWVYI